MGVMTCDRKGCDNVLCDRYSPEYGYICHECFEELCNTRDSISIRGFMNTKKGSRSVVRSLDIYNYYDSIFPDIMEQITGEKRQ